MSHDDNSIDLSLLERRLKCRRMDEPSAMLQSRIMHAVAQELRGSSAASRRRGGVLSFAATMAAVLFIGVNLSQSATSATRLDRPFTTTPEQTLDDAAAIQQLSPELSQADAVRMSLLLHAGRNLRELPEVHGLASFESDAPDGAYHKGNPP